MNIQSDKKQFSVLSAATSVLRNGLAAFMGYSHLGQRDLFKQFGYARDLQFRDFAGLYRRNAVAARIIRAFPSATWKDCPSVLDDVNKDVDSTFEVAWQDFYEQHRVGFYFERADRLAGLGHYSVLLLGFADGLLDKPLPEGSQELLYMSPYSEDNANIDSFDLNVTSERFGLPLMYTLKKGNPFSSGRPTKQTKSIRVHYSRVIHIAELLDDDEVYGTPRLECTYNHLKDLEKVVGGSAETFWLNARQGLALTIDKDANVSDDTLTDMKAQAEEFEHQLRRILTMKGITPTTLNATVADPEHNVSCLLDLIAGGQGMPKRILIGSERGELASSQDESNWSTRIEERRGAFATPMVLRPFIDCMIATGNLPEPIDGTYDVEWPEVAAQSPKEKSEIAEHKANALRSYTSSPGAELIIPQQEFREWLGEAADSEYADDTTELDPFNENDTNVTSQFASAFGGKPADTAMNGLQISSLKDIVIAVGAKEMPPDAAVQLIMACFPNIDEVQARAIIDPMIAFTPPKPPTPQIPPT
jgi:hypothetical protein